MHFPFSSCKDHFSCGVPAPALLSFTLRILLGNPSHLNKADWTSLSHTHLSTWLPNCSQQVGVNEVAWIEESPGRGTCEGGLFLMGNSKFTAFLWQRSGSQVIDRETDRLLAQVRELLPLQLCHEWVAEIWMQSLPKFPVSSHSRLLVSTV